MKTWYKRSAYRSQVTYREPLHSEQKLISRIRSFQLSNCASSNNSISFRLTEYTRPIPFLFFNRNNRSRARRELNGCCHAHSTMHHSVNIFKINLVYLVHRKAQNFVGKPWINATICLWQTLTILSKLPNECDFTKVCRKAYAWHHSLSLRYAAAIFGVVRWCIRYKCYSYASAHFQALANSKRASWNQSIKYN